MLKGVELPKGYNFHPSKNVNHTDYARSCYWEHARAILSGSNKCYITTNYELIKQWMALKIKEEVEKQWNAGFLAIAEYPQWVANIVLIPKKDGKVRMYVDYRDLNKASPKDNFSLPHIDMLVDNTAQHAFFSFMDGFSYYNQIQMALEDREKNLHHHLGYFLLQNTGTTFGGPEEAIRKTLKVQTQVKPGQMHIWSKVGKAARILEHLAYHPVSDYQPLLPKFPDEHIVTIAKIEPESDEWTLWFDGAFNLLGNGIRAVWPLQKTNASLSRLGLVLTAPTTW
ncbi:hypothetical protein CR513_18940, partial [Mucuna pruriens]